MRKWQNLLYQQCPDCERIFQTAKRNGHLIFECPDEECGFAITVTKLVDILSDKNHILRTFLTKEQIKALDQALKQ